jgi:regulator of protease activity HflC (stomatin/prohibitin superfamily)
MKRFLLALAALAVVVLLACFCFVRIGPDEIGVRADNVGERGIVPHDFEPGIHVGLPFVHTWTRLPATVRRIDMNDDPRRRGPIGTDTLSVTSADGDLVHVDLAILFQIQKGKAFQVVNDSGPDKDAFLNHLKSLAIDRLRASFGTLTTEKFYDPAARRQMTATAQKELQAALEPRHVDVVDLLVQDVFFDPQYEKKIREKKLADQNQQVTMSEGARDQAKATVALTKIDTENQKKLIATDAENEAQTIVSAASVEAARTKRDADVYHSEKVAAGKKARATADAAVNAAQTDALAGPGASNYVAREAVEGLNIQSLVLPTGTIDDPWKLFEALLQSCGVKR